MEEIVSTTFYATISIPIRIIPRSPRSIYIISRLWIHSLSEDSIFLVLRYVILFSLCFCWLHSDSEQAWAGPEWELDFIQKRGFLWKAWTRWRYLSGSGLLYIYITIIAADQPTRRTGSPFIQRAQFTPRPGRDIRVMSLKQIFQVDHVFFQRNSLSTWQKRERTERKERGVRIRISSII